MNLRKTCFFNSDNFAFIVYQTDFHGSVSIQLCFSNFYMINRY